MEEKKNNKVVKVIILIVIIIVCVGIGIGISYFFINKQNNQENSKSNEDVILNSQVGKLSEKSFNNMKSNNEELEDMQKQILEYYDNDYFEIYSSDALKKYPQVLKDTKVKTPPLVVKKIIKSTDEEYEVLVSFGYNLESSFEEIDYALKGVQLDERLIEGESIRVYGKYTDTNTYQVDGKSYTVPTIMPINIVRGENNRYDFDTISKVAKYIFGNGIKITEPDDEEIWEDNDTMYNYYKITLDNQSNANFKSFKMDKNAGYIAYNKTENNLSDDVSKTLRVSSDFEHFIVETRDSKLNKYYIDYFDKSYNKLWSREFDCKLTTSSVSTMDYTTEKMAIVVDNDLYLIDLETGENIIEPVIVGTKMKVNMFDDGVILIGNENKDTIMKVDFNGNILYRVNADTSMSISDVYTQIVNDKLVIRIIGDSTDNIQDVKMLEKYIVLNNDGTIEYSTNETSRA